MGSYDSRSRGCIGLHRSAAVHEGMVGPVIEYETRLLDGIGVRGDGNITGNRNNFDAPSVRGGTEDRIEL